MATCKVVMEWFQDLSLLAERRHVPLALFPLFFHNRGNSELNRCFCFRIASSVDREMRVGVSVEDRYRYGGAMGT